MKILTVSHNRILCVLLAFVILFGAFAVFPEKAYAADDFYDYPLYYGDTRLAGRGYWIKGNVYVPVSVLQQHGDCSKLTFATSSSNALKLTVSFDLAKLNLQMADAETTAFVRENGGTVSMLLKKCFYGSGSSQYDLCASVTALEQITKLSGYFDEERQRIVLYPYPAQDATIGILTADCALTPSFVSYSQQQLLLYKGDTCFVIGETESYYKVCTTCGETGYVFKSAVQLTDQTMTGLDFYAPSKGKNFDTSLPLSLAWVSANSTSGITEEAPTKHWGLDVLSPTWLRLTADGTVTNLTDAGFVRQSVMNGYTVWGAITNSFDRAITANLFASAAIRKKAIAQYLFWACYYDWTGINIDFETFATSANAAEDAKVGKQFTAFVQELRKWTERQGLYLSADVPQPETYYSEYEYAALADTLDYLMVMTYDQNYSGSTYAGSVSSVSWTEDKIRELLALGVPAEKVIMGLPFYTRVWVSDSNHQVMSSAMASSLGVSRNASVTMDRMQEIIAENGLVPVWNGGYVRNSGTYRTSQYYVSWPLKENTSYQNEVWIEDNRSIANRLALVNEYHLAGACGWQLSQSSLGVWDVFQGILKNGDPPALYQ